MNKYDILGYVVIVVVLAASAYMYFNNSDSFNLKCIISTVDGNKYCVRERSKEQAAADLLASVTKKCKQLVDYMNQKHSDDDRVKRLVSGFNPQKVMETLPNSVHTAYSENKGEKVAFCLNRSKNNNDNLIDMPTLMFVAIHELSHIMTESIGHKSDFWANFKFLLENAKAAGIHDPVDYKSKPAKYCGMEIKDNPYYDV